jgi:hypothetical protein
VKDMKKVLIVFLIGVLLLGVVGAAAGVKEQSSVENLLEWNNETSPDDPGATPCGGGNGGGGAPG